MAAYVVAEITVTDPETYAEYKALAGATVTAHGGRYVARGGAVDCVEGDPPGERVVILEFPDLDRAREWYHSAAYQEAAALRQAASKSRVYLVEGVAP